MIRPIYQNQISGSDVLDYVSGMDAIGAKKQKPTKQQKQANQAAKKAVKVKAKQQKKAASVAKKAAQKAAGHCNGSLLKKVVLAPARNAFLALVKLNIKSIGTKLVRTYNQPDKRRKLFQKWCKLGGSSTALQSAILSVARKKKIAIVGVALESILAAAAAIIKQLKEFLPDKINEAVETAQNAVQSFTEQDKKEIAQLAENPEIQSAGVRRMTATVRTSTNDDGERVQTVANKNATDQELDAAEETAATVKNESGVNPLLIAGIAAAGIYAISKK